MARYKSDSDTVLVLSLWPDGEGDMAQAQWVVVSSLTIFTQMQQEVRGDPNHIDGRDEFGSR